MEETNLIGEQPESCSSQVVNTNKLEVKGEAEQGGSPFGKFKNAESLYEAYNNLQSEFTRKCQKVKELEVKLSDNSENLTNLNKNSVEINEKLGVGTNLNENNVKLNEPQYLSSNWHENVKEFIKNNPKAKNFAKEISNILINNKEIASLTNALDVSYAMVLSKKYISADELLQDEDFVNSKILNNSEIKNRIVNKYLNEVSKNIVPPVISKTCGSQVQVSRIMANSLEDAKRQAELLFKN